MSNKKNEELKVKENTAQKLNDKDVENASGGMGFLASTLTTIAISEGAKIIGNEISRRRKKR